MKKKTNILCLILGHEDPVFAGVGFESTDSLYDKWEHWFPRYCTRCKKEIAPITQKPAT